MDPSRSAAFVRLNLACVLAACSSDPGVTTGAATGTDTSTGTSTSTGPSTTGTDPTTSASAPTTDPTTAPTTDPTTGTTTDPTTGTDSSSSTTTPCTPGTCGDGVLDCDEACDDGPANSDILQGACRTDCSLAGCGDSVVDYVLGEQCDDGNQAAGDGCDDACQVEAALSCGDGALDLDQGEACDDGNQADGDGCSAACQLELVGQQCGDGAMDGLEVCDDGNLDNGDACNPTCNLTNTTELFVGAPGQIGLQDGVGMNARISGTGALTADLTHLYLADAQNNCIRKIDVMTAQVETIAGSINGTAGYVDSPDGLMARFAGLESITTDGKTLWVADGMNKRIRAVSLTPPYAVTTVAGNGMAGLQDGIGDAATFEDNRGLTYYAGHVYLVDAVGAVLRRLDPATGEVVTLAGQPYTAGTVDGVGMSAQFVSPRYMTSDNSGMLYIADTNGYHIRSYNTVTGYVGTFAGNGVQGYADGVGTSASIHRPRGMTSDGTSIYFAEFNQHTIRQGILATGEVSTNAGQHCGGMNCMGGYVEGVGTAARFNGPFSLTFHFPSNSLFILDGANRVIRRLR
ncbi:MAG TPA: hypothetical protein VIK91_17920 [Nannocystis sp.]